MPSAPSMSPEGPRGDHLDSAPILLPLLYPPSTALHASSPPLELLPGGELPGARIVFRQESKSTSSAPKEVTRCVNWVATSHVFPAAYPCSHPGATTPPCEPYPHAEPLPLPSSSSATGTADPGISEEKRRRQVDLEEWKRRKARHSSMRALQPPSTEKEAEERARELAAKAFPQLWSSVQRIVPMAEARSAPVAVPASSMEDARGTSGYTLLFAHANGLHKETWEATLPSLLESLEGNDITGSGGGGKVRIDEIWSLDTMGSGESGILNRDTLGEVVSWFDGARNIKQFIDRYLPAARPPRPENAGMGPGWPQAVLPRADRGSQAGKKKIIAVGHSFSGACLSMLAGTEPELFEAVILIDPVLFHADNFSSFQGQAYSGFEHPAATGTIARRDIWPTREAARSYFLSRPFFQAFERRALESYIRHAVRPVFARDGGSHTGAQEGKPVAFTLTTSKWTEAQLFATSAMGSYGVAALTHGRLAADRPVTTQMGSDQPSDSDESVTGPRSTRRLKMHHFVMQHTVQTEKDTAAVRDAIQLACGGKTEMLSGGHLVVQEQPDLIGRKIAEALKAMLLGGENANGEVGAAQVSYKAPPARL